MASTPEQPLRIGSTHFQQIDPGGSGGEHPQNMQEIAGSIALLQMKQVQTKRIERFGESILQETHEGFTRHWERRQEAGRDPVSFHEIKAALHAGEFAEGSIGGVTTTSMVLERRSDVNDIVHLSPISEQVEVRRQLYRSLLLSDIERTIADHPETPVDFNNLGQHLAFAYAREREYELATHIAEAIVDPEERMLTHITVAQVELAMERDDLRKRLSEDEANFVLSGLVARLQKLLMVSMASVSKSPDDTADLESIERAISELDGTKEPWRRTWRAK